MLFIHETVGYLIYKGITYKKKIPPNIRFIILSICFLFSIGPDWDIFISPVLGFPMFRHREMFTHTPIFWILISIILYIIIILFKSINKKYQSDFSKNNINLIIIASFLSPIIHILLDMFTGKIKIFWPISEKNITILGNVLPYPFKSIEYITHPAFIIEICISIFVVLLIIHDYIKNIKPVLTSTVGIFVILFLFTTLLQISSLQNKLPINNNPDIDYDKSRNTEDFDINGNYILNYYDFLNTSIESRKNAINIIDSNYLVVKNDLSSYSLWKITPLVKNNLDLVDRYFKLHNFSIEYDFKYDCKAYPQEYENCIFNVENLKKYTNDSRFDNDIYRSGDIIYSDVKGYVDVFIIVEVLDDGYRCKNVTDNWYIQDIIIESSNILR